MKKMSTDIRKSLDISDISDI